ncbi:YiiG family protein [Paenibacillus fonticola]|uniref:YiiG family protein n=1 Tax=Paenibacillus fonticola TaxID=379896 RepID=UPI00047746C9|nr:YiiG family protein [Paenibacillus fonticola]
MSRRLHYILCSILLCFLLSSCSLIDEIKGSSNRSGLSVEEEHANAKYSAYINLNNMMTGGMFDRMMETYIDEFGLDEEIYISDDFSEFTSAPVLDGLVNAVNTAVDRASGEPSYGDADASLILLGPTMLDLIDTMKEISTYYSAKTFVDDQFVKGKELHRQFIAQYEEYGPLADQFFDDFDLIAAQQKLKDLDKLKEQDLLIRYYALSVVMRAQDIEKAFFDAEIYDENILDYDLEEYRAMYDLLTDDLNQFMEYSKDDKRRKKEAWSTLPVLDSSMQGVKVTATDILQILETGDATINSDTQGKVTTGGRNAILSSYFTKVSRLVDAYNNNIKVKVGN